MKKIEVKSVKEVIHSDIHRNIEYEWVILRENLDRKYIRGMYSSLDRLVKLYKQRDIKM